MGSVIQRPGWSTCQSDGQTPQKRLAMPMCAPPLPTRHERPTPCVAGERTVHHPPSHTALPNMQIQRIAHTMHTCKRTNQGTHERVPASCPHMERATSVLGRDSVIHRPSSHTCACALQDARRACRGRRANRKSGFSLTHTYTFKHMHKPCELAHWAGGGRPGWRLRAPPSHKHKRALTNVFQTAPGTARGRAAHQKPDHTHMHTNGCTMGIYRLRWRRRRPAWLAAPRSRTRQSTKPLQCTNAMGRG